MEIKEFELQDVESDLKPSRPSPEVLAGLMTITRSMLFRGKMPRKSNIFYVAKYVYAGSKMSSGFEVIIAKEKELGEEAVKQCVREQVLKMTNG